jgi:hypothetical protein
MSNAAPQPPRGRPPAPYFVLVALLVAIGVLAPIGVSRYQRHRATMIPLDTTGNRPDSARPAALPPDSVKAHD